MSKLPPVLQNMSLPVIGSPLFIIKNDPALTEDEVANFCHANLTGYKRPKYIEFRDELPKSNVGKILRRELRTAK